MSRRFDGGDGTVVVITGGSRGIGRASAIAFARRGARLVLAARDELALESAAADCAALGAEVVTVVADISDPRQNDDIVRTAVERFGGIDVWVGAASVLAYGTVADGPDEVRDRVVEVNLLGQMRSTAVALRHFRERGRGRIVLVGSLFSVIAAPYLSAYVASKFGLLGFARALRQELLTERRIDVRVVLPATIDTAIYQRAANATGRAPHAIPPVVAPERVARAIVRAAAGSGKHEVTVGHVQGLGAPFSRLSPRAFDRMMRIIAETIGLHGTAPDTSGAVLQPLRDEGTVLGGWRSTVARAVVVAAAVVGVASLAARRRARR
jgi:short-subunit dehydrogenase